MKKLIALTLALVMALALTVPALAVEEVGVIGTLTHLGVDPENMKAQIDSKLTDEVTEVTPATTTQQIPGNPEPGRIYRADRRIFIDCGCAFGGPLGVLCLDTGDVFYA